MNHDLLTIPEVAEFLRVAERTVYMLTQRGEISPFKVGGQWRFGRGAIQARVEACTRAGQQPGAEMTSPSASDEPGDAAKAKRRRR
jgi:excisionase family DNA binding protein